MHRVLHIATAQERLRHWQLTGFVAEHAFSAAGAGEGLSTADCILLWCDNERDLAAELQHIAQRRNRNPVPVVLAVDPSAAVALPPADGLVDQGWPADLVAWALDIAMEHIRLGVHVTRIQREALEMARAEATDLYDKAVRDDLTGLYNRRYYEDIVPLEHQRSRRQSLSYALVVIDLDDLKALNSRFGHAGGSDALRLVAKTMSEIKRSTDHAFRFGGDEFAVLLTDCNKSGAGHFANRLLEKLQQHRLQVSACAERKHGAEEVALSVSMGIAAFPQDGATPEEVFTQADTALFRAKAGGKGRAVEAGAEGGGHEDQ